MAQNSLVIPSTGILSGLQLVLDINAAIASIATQNAGPTAPLDPVQYQLWYDTTTGILMVYNGAAWIPQTNGAALSGVEVVTSNLTIGKEQVGLLLECQGATPLTLTLPNAADYLGSNVSAFNELTGGATVTITIAPSGGSFVGLGASGTSYNLPPNYVSQFISDGYDWIMIGSSGLAPVSGSANNQFNVANATTPSNALPLSQAQGLFAALNGSASQVFNVANAVTNTQAPNLGQANGLYGQLAQSNTWAQRQILNGGATVPAQSGAITAGTAPSGAPASFSQVALPSGYTNLIESYYNGSTQVYKLDANGNVTISGGITLAGAIVATGTASAAPATVAANLLQLGQLQNGSLSPSFANGTFSGNVVVSGTVSGAPAASAGELLQLNQIQNGSLSPSFANGTFSGNVVVSGTVSGAPAASAGEFLQLDQIQNGSLSPSFANGTFSGIASATNLVANASLTTKTASVSGTITQAAGTGPNNQTPFLQFSDIFADQIATGLVTTTSASLSGSLSSGVAYADGQRVYMPLATPYVAPASSLSYLDLSWTGTLSVTPSGSPQAPNSLRLWEVSTSATAISGVTLLAPTTAVHPEVRNTLTFSASGTTLLTEEQSSSWIRTTAAGMTINLPVTPSSGTYFYIEGNPNGTVLVSGNGAQLLLPGGVASVSSVTIPAVYGDWIFVNWIDSAWRTEVVYAPIIQTPAQFDVSNLAATTAFVQQACGNFSGYTQSGITGSGTGISKSTVGNVVTNYPIVGTTTQLGPQAWGTECQIASSISGTTTYMPAGLAGFFGNSILFKNDSPAPQIVAVNTSGAFIYDPALGLGTTNTQITLQPGQSAIILSRSLNENDIVGGSFLT